jgi:hypothetical protein
MFGIIYYIYVLTHKLYKLYFCTLFDNVGKNLRYSEATTSVDLNKLIWRENSNRKIMKGDMTCQGIS